MTSRVRLGIVGTGRIARKFVEDLRFVPAIEVAAVFNPRIASAEQFAAQWDAESVQRPVPFDSFDAMVDAVDAVYIASPSETHIDYAERALRKSVHVLCEKPVAFRKSDVEHLYSLARLHNAVFLHAVKTAFFPGFRALERAVASGVIGDVVDVEASFTKLLEGNVPELCGDGTGGSMRWLSTYPLYAISRLVGSDLRDARFFTRRNNEDVDIFTRAFLVFPEASASFKVGFGAKTDGVLVITGTKGYIRVPAPWWNTTRFEVHFEDSTDVRLYLASSIGNGLNYEARAFAEMIDGGELLSCCVTEADDIFFSEVYELFS